MKKEIIKELKEAQEVQAKLVELTDEIEVATKMVISSLSSGGKVVLFGNGGSAADAQHIAAELVGRFNIDRRALPAVSLTTNTSILTSLSNDYDFKSIFARQIDALLGKNDIVIAISTSGGSLNVIEGIKKAKQVGVKVIGLTGKDGGLMASLVDLCIKIPSEAVSHIQEAHITIGHIICFLIEKAVAEKELILI